MLKRRIAYKTYANQNGINKSNGTVKGSYDETEKTIEVKIGIDYAEEYDEIFVAMASKKNMINYMATQGETITEEQAGAMIEENLGWMCEVLNCKEQEAKAILAII